MGRRKACGKNCSDFMNIAFAQPCQAAVGCEIDRSIIISKITSGVVAAAKCISNIIGNEY